MVENPEITPNSIQKFERKGEDVLIEIAVPPNTNKGQFQRTFETNYEAKIAKLEAKIDELQTLRIQDMREIVLALAVRQPQTTITATAESKTMSDNQNIQTVDVKGGSVGGDFNASHAILNIDNLNSTITNQINKLPATSEPDRPGMKELLSQLQTTINADNNLSDKNKNKALKQVQNLAEAGKYPKNNAMKEIADDATTMLKGIITGLPAAAKLAETCEKIIPAIASIFGL
ncbi:MAG: hypothetical protein J7647_07030 [Cyanobacteria bacterium SBLK]|nr:hypothetical protein [Cyanobacteria bacterium SBLK]